ncbi:MAG TPA: hypothetical protein VGQ84_14685 [Gaiellaceae bacterium]|nr:hypothetical protein [Gaiellaceae bacterium]
MDEERERRPRIVFVVAGFEASVDEEAAVTRLCDLLSRAGAEGEGWARRIEAAVTAGDAPARLTLNASDRDVFLIALGDKDPGTHSSLDLLRRRLLGWRVADDAGPETGPNVSPAA